tara:strand:- start:263 stop:490 length:228 start_codon:yes stop_codon:yes gene_type:complete
VSGIFNLFPSMVSETVIIDQSHERFMLVFLSPNEKLIIPRGTKRESKGCTNPTGTIGKGLTISGDVGKYSGRRIL